MQDECISYWVCSKNTGSHYSRVCYSEVRETFTQYYQYTCKMVYWTRSTAGNERSRSKFRSIYLWEITVQVEWFEQNQTYKLSWNLDTEYGIGIWFLLKLLPRVLISGWVLTPSTRPSAYSRGMLCAAV